MGKIVEFSSIVSNFESGIRALRVFNDEIGELVQERDRVIMEQFLEKFIELAGIDPPDLSNDAENLDDGGESRSDFIPVTKFTTHEQIQKSFEEKSQESEDEPLAPDRDSNEFTVSFSDPVKARALGTIAQALVKRSPNQIDVLRRGALTTLVSYFEILTANLLEWFYINHPDALPSTETKLLSLAELYTLGSISEAENYMISKEVDSVMRQSLESQLKELSSRLKIDLSPLKHHTSDLAEVFLRRNLFVHNDGVVNRIYLSQLSKYIDNLPTIEEGEHLILSSSYIKEAIDCLHVCGIILIEQCWRKWDHTEEARHRSDRVLVDSTYELLLEQNWDQVLKLAAYASTIKKMGEVERRIVAINSAIACKALGDFEKLNIILAEFDWSACALRFKIALCALRDQTDSLMKQITKAVASEEIKREDLEEWPLFKEFRNIEGFSEFMIELFPVEPDARDSAQDISVA